MTNCQFLLDFKAKLAYFKYINSSSQRALYYLYQNLKDLESSVIGKIKRKKLRVSREKILESAIKIFKHYGHKKCILEFQFAEEEGTGLGPTLEYLGLIAQELRFSKLNLWRSFNQNYSLFPAPIDPKKLQMDKSGAVVSSDCGIQKVQAMFRLAGQVVARAILDDRVVELPFNPLFWSIVLDKPIFFMDIIQLDETFGENFASLQSVLNQKKQIEQNSQLSPNKKGQQIRDLKYQGCKIEDLALTFTLVGYPEIELIENGNDMPVTLSNLETYITMTLDFFLHQTIQLQVSSFKEGFNQVFPLSQLNSFKNSEIEILYCGDSLDNSWELLDLQAFVLPAYGYTNQSKQFNEFLEIMKTFNKSERRNFIRFVTGSSRLPFGGFQNLNPKLTIVKKHPNFEGQKPDQMLPSVMTCQNYLKLPEYTSIAIMKEKITVAITEGQENFTLS